MEIHTFYFAEDWTRDYKPKNKSLEGKERKNKNEIMNKWSRGKMNWRGGRWDL
jgi:hypothetical protein